MLSCLVTERCLVKPYVRISYSSILKSVTTRDPVKVLRFIYEKQTLKPSVLNPITKRIPCSTGLILTLNPFFGLKMPTRDIRQIGPMKLSCKNTTVFSTLFRKKKEVFTLWVMLLGRNYKFNDIQFPPLV